MARQRALIVEDDATMRRGLVDNFVSAGYEVRAAQAGDSGLELALAWRPDLIVLDIMLPRKNGYELCAELRSADCDVPIIMLTAKGDEDDIVRGLNLGADDYMTKPFRVRELLARAAAFLRRRAPAAPALSFGPYRLDRDAHRLLRDGLEVTMTPKEYRLLEYMLARAGRALTRDQILTHVWGSHVMVTTRSVDRCVTTLRRKIEPDPAHPTFIHTIRDIGYRFEPPSDL